MFKKELRTAVPKTDIFKTPD